MIELYSLIVYPIIIFVGCFIFYRLYLSPLVKFPGPKLAAATGWFETYFELIKGGQFIWEIERMHRKYGPIVRIGPSEIHIQDPTFYETLYGGTIQKRDKDACFVNVGLPQCCFSTASYSLHRTRRSTLLPFFTTQGVIRFEPFIRKKVDRLSQHLADLIDTGEAVDLHALFMCFAADIMSAYTFGSSQCFDYLEQPVITDDWKKKVNSVFEILVYGRHFPWLFPLSRALSSVNIWLHPQASSARKAEMVRN